MLNAADNNLKEMNQHQRIGSILIESGKIKAHDAVKIHDYQKKKHKLFGEAAVKLKIISKDDLEQALANQFSFPYLDRRNCTLSKDLVTAYRPFSTEAEAIRNIRSQLLLQWQTNEHKTLAVVSPSNGDGRSYLAANLAILFAQMDFNTLIIDADLRRPSQHELFSISNEIGLSTFLAGRISSDAVVGITKLSNLSVLPAGPTPPNPQELVSKPEFAMLLNQYAKHFDVIIVDTPAANETADCELIVSAIGNALLVAQKDKTKIDEMKVLSEKLKHIRANVVGTVFNKYHRPTMTLKDVVKAINSR